MVVSVIQVLSSLLNTMETMKKYGIETHIEFVIIVLVSKGRNNLIARAMHNPKTTHMLFIDNDVAMGPSWLKLVHDDKELVEANLSLKRYNWNRMV